MALAAVKSKDDIFSEPSSINAIQYVSFFVSFKWLGVNKIKTAQVCRKTFVIICRNKMILFPLRSEGTVRRLIPTSNGSS